MSLEEILLLAEKRLASDIILSPDNPPALRVSGRLEATRTSPLTASSVEQMIRALLHDEGFQRFVAKRELDFSLTYLGHRLRGNAYWRSGAPAMALRLIPSEIPSPEQLGLPPILHELVKLPQGLILSTGAVGQGKTTTQAALVEMLNQHEARHIITIEDPIEFVHRSTRSIIDQREVGSDTGSFADALRHVMRQNPDVILVGEMRDLETIAAALTVAETGHLVLSTLHANDACQALDRIIDVFPSTARDQVRTQLSLVLLAVVNQRLVRSKSGRLMLAAEVLHNNPAIAKLIREGKTAQLYGAMELDTYPGVQTMNQALEALVARGLVHQAEAERYMSRRESRHT